RTSFLAGGSPGEPSRDSLKVLLDDVVSRLDLLFNSHCYEGIPCPQQLLGTHVEQILNGWCFSSNEHASSRKMLNFVRTLSVPRILSYHDAFRAPVEVFNYRAELAGFAVGFTGEAGRESS
ncbi:MAG: hypothetical protein SNJ82_12935, partial [Gemmataceae bacterium]